MDARLLTLDNIMDSEVDSLPGATLGIQGGLAEIAIEL